MMLAFVAAVLAAVSCGTKKEAPQQKVLVLYYSQAGSTKAVAQELATKLGADMEEIIPVTPYEGDFQALLVRYQQEVEQGILPELKPIKADLAQYDVIFLGFPVWNGTYAPPVAAFLETADLSGKKIVPFCSFGSGGLDTSERALKEKLPGAEILPGYGVRKARLQAMPAEVDNFLKASGFIEGEYTPLPDFTGQHAVSEEESAIFDTAVGDYPMIKAKATTVTQRTIPGGTEYLFTAANLPREGAAPDEPTGEIKVYVTVLEGQAPEFTQVLR